MGSSPKVRTEMKGLHAFNDIEIWGARVVVTDMNTGKQRVFFVTADPDKIRIREKSAPMNKRVTRSWAAPGKSCPHDRLGEPEYNFRRAVGVYIHSSAGACI